MFFRLPPEVISNHILSLLHVNDLLRLRRVSKVSKELADDYLRLHGTSERVVFINVDEGSDDMTTFLALPFIAPVTRFNFVNEDNSSWGREHMQLFSSLYCDKITHLEIYRLVIPIVLPAAVQFFEGLPNLTELRIEDLDSDNSDYLNLPSTFKRLKNLNVETYSCRPQLLCEFMNECSTNLERVNFPRTFYSHEADETKFEWVKRIVERRHEQHPDKPNLMYYDMANFVDYRNPADVRSFYELVTTCFAHNVKLQHVDARLIEDVMKLDTPDRGLHGHKISRCVESIINYLSKSVFYLELPLLEKIDIEGTELCSMPGGDFEAQPWSNLKELKLLVDSERLYAGGDGERVDVSCLFEFLFHGIRRENLESLDLKYYSDNIMPYPDMTSVCSSCPNLKKLYLWGWPGSNRDIAQLWGNLPLLEDVTFADCATLTDAAFIGDDVNQPALLKATRLKSLKLEGLETMPGITDRLFKCALPHMPLKALYLSSWGRVSWITLAGLESLLRGKFAFTIEKFPLKWRIQLEGVTDEQLAELEGMFRSAQM